MPIDAGIAGHVFGTGEVLNVADAYAVPYFNADVDRRTHDLVLLSELLSRLENEPFRTPLLRRLVKALQTDGLPASTRIRRLAPRRELPRPVPLLRQ